MNARKLFSSVSLSGIATFSLALLVRLVYNSTVARDYYPLHDSLTYQTIAFNVLRDHCYCLLPHLQTVDRAPLWPMIIAMIYGLAGPHEYVVRFFLCLVGSGTCVLLYWFAKDLFGQAIALCIGGVAVLYPFLYIYDGWLYAESLYTFFLFAFCYTLFRLQNSPRFWLMALSGILLGLLSLTRPNGMLMLVPFSLWVLVLGWRKIQSWSVLGQIASITLIIYALVVVPWTIRNALITHTFLPVAIGDGKVLLGAYNDLVANPAFAQGYYFTIWIKPSLSFPSVDRHFPTDCAGPCEVRRDDAYKHAAIQWIRNHPNTILKMLALHFLNTWQTTTQEADLPLNRFPYRTTSQAVVMMMKVMTPAILTLAAFGLLLMYKHWYTLLPIYSSIALTLLQNTLLYGIPRFRAPLEPMLLLLAAGALWHAALFLKKLNLPARTKKYGKLIEDTLRRSRQRAENELFGQ